MYSGPVVHHRPPIGIKPTPEDHKFVHALSLIGQGVREICAALGKRFKLGKPMSRLMLYHYFRADLTIHKRGPRKKIAAKETVAERMKRLLAKIDEKSGRKKRKKYPEKTCKRCGTTHTDKVCLACIARGMREMRARRKREQQANG